jgi:hypothetical protein
MADIHWGRAMRYLFCLLVPLASVVLAAGCSSGGGSGPLGTLMAAGKPDFDVDSLGVTPGQAADGMVTVVNSAHTPVTITAVSAINVPGTPAAHLADAGVAGMHGIAATRGWPPPVPVKPAIGATLPYGQTNIIYGITGTVTGRNYAAAGLQITYSYDGQKYTVVAWGGDMACVVANLDSSADAATCNASYNKVNAAIEKLSGLT